MAPQGLRALLESPGILVAPGVYDGVSARLAERAGFRALYLSGYGVSASRLGVPDVGILGLEDLLGAVRAVRRASALPLVADADTGFGDAQSLRRAVCELAEAGAQGIQLEDQVYPKRCGHTLGREVVSVDEMLRRIEHALASRPGPDFVLVARTDARTHLGFDEALRRGRRYAEAGADVVFVESPESEAELARIAAEIPKPTLANLVEGGRTPLVPVERLEALGFKMVIHPVTALLAGTRAAREALGALRASGDPARLADRLEPFEAMNELVGFPEAEEALRKER